MEKITKKKEIWAIILIVILLIALNLSINLTGNGITPNGGDDKAFAQFVLGKHYLQFLHSRYTGWSSRLVIESVLSTLTHLPILWRLLNTLAMFTVIYIPYLLLLKGTDDDENASRLLISFGMFFLLPFNMFYETGWMATTTNYLWVLAAGLLAMLPSLAQYLGIDIKHKKIISVIAFLALIYAVNQEQMVIILLLGNSLLLYVTRGNKKALGRLAFQFVVTVLSLIMIALAPGNSVRKVKEIHWLPLFPTLSPFKKIELGISSTLGHFFFSFDVLATILVILLFAFYINQKGRYKIPRTVFYIPVLFSVIFWFKDTLIGKIYPGLKKMGGAVTIYGTDISLANLQSILPDLLLIVVSCIVLLGIFSSGNSKRMWLVMVAMLLGLISRIMMGFSPTIWASGERTFLFLYEALIFGCFYLYDQIEKKKEYQILTHILIGIGGLAFCVILYTV
ncbi:hypothetical protein LCW_02005 [Latilactobacillus curvatus]|uniref:DUF6056 family protein n=1 Tax=Latilactobacillus curvatus TaxID=28038 RepID=UPI000849FB65|nr:DUF6056 family protein [Latilactobacillus curvatus]AOO74927.1 hypothetical protein LCW_02005 [Latilactobacillus curvatus]